MQNGVILLIVLTGTAWSALQPRAEPEVRRFESESGRAEFQCPGEKGHTEMLLCLPLPQCRLLRGEQPCFHQDQGDVTALPVHKLLVSAEDSGPACSCKAPMSHRDWDLQCWLIHLIWGELAFCAACHQETKAKHGQTVVHWSQIGQKVQTA